VTDNVSIALSVALLADAGIAALIGLQSHRWNVRLVFVALSLDAILMTLGSLSSDLGLAGGGPAWEALAWWSFNLYHPLLTLYVILYVHGRDALRRFPYLLALVAPLPILGALGATMGIGAATGSGISWIGYYLLASLAIGLAEATVWWLRSALHRFEAAGLMLAAAASIFIGPIYGELGVWSLPWSRWTCLGAPLVLGVLAGVALLADSLPIPRPVPASEPGQRFESGRVAFLDEIRPKYLHVLVRRAADSGQPTLLLQRGTVDPAPNSRTLPESVYGPARVASTIREFADRYSGGVVAVRDLGDIACRAGVEIPTEIASEAVALARSGRIGLLVSTSGLTGDEREALGRKLGSVIPMPRPEQEIEAIIAGRIGSMARRVVQGYALGEGKRREDLTHDDVPAIADYMKWMISELVRIPGERPLTEGWSQEVDRISQDLDRFARFTPDVLAVGRNRTVSPKHVQIPVVKAGEYWRDREPEETAGVGRGGVAPLPLEERLRQAFLMSFGPAGLLVHDLAVQRIREGTDGLSLHDITAIAASVKGTAAALAAAIDTEEGKSDLKDRTRALQERLYELWKVRNEA